MYGERRAGILHFVRIIHSIVVERSSVELSELRSLGVDVEPSALPLIFLNVGEDEDRWPRVQAWIDRTGARESVYTIFSAEETASAEWLRMCGDWPHTYPQPDDNSNGCLEATYDLHDYCQHCGIGLQQVAPFQMRAEPNWGGEGVRQYGFFGEIFVRPEVYADCFEPFGVRSRPVHGPGGSPLESIVQIVVDENIDVVVDETMTQLCTVCRRAKCLPPTRGRFPAMTSAPRAAMVRTAQWFGGDSIAQQLILISQPIAAALTEHHVRGATLHPVAPA